MFNNFNQITDTSPPSTRIVVPVAVFAPNNPPPFRPVSNIPAPLAAALPVIAGVDRLTPNVSQFKQGDILAMPGMGRATSRTDDLMMTPSLNVPSPKPTSSQMNPSVASSGSLFDAFKS